MCETDVVKNYKDIDKRVTDACKRAGRKRNDVTLIAVSKTKPDYMVNQLSEIGVNDFGENKPQELMRKADTICPEKSLHWHMIGNIQTNKVKMFVSRACLIHSVPDLHIAQAISKQAEKDNVTAHILIEVNVAGEETKHGLIIDNSENRSCSADELMGPVSQLVKEIALLPNISIDGLMQIAPPVDNPEDNRILFKTLKMLRDKIRDLNIKNAPMTELSMGMTNDFEVAIEEGATFVRVGTAIFGARDYSK